MELYPIVLAGIGLYKLEDPSEDETTTDGGGGRSGGGGGEAEHGCSMATETARGVAVARAAWVEAMMLLAVSLYFNLKISALTALSSACKDCTSCCNAEIAPMQPYTGSRSLTLAS